MEDVLYPCLVCAEMFAIMAIGVRAEEVPHVSGCWEDERFEGFFLVEMPILRSVPDAWESIYWHAFFVLPLVGAVFLVMELLHACAVRKQEQYFSDRQYLQTTMSRLALEDRVSVLMQERFLLEHLLLEPAKWVLPP